MSSATPAVSVEVYQQPDGYWRWRWVQREGDEEKSLISYRTFDSVAEAKESAEGAYPGAQVQAPEDPAESGRHRPRRPRRVLLVLALVALAALAARRRRDG